MVKNLPANVRDVSYSSLIPGSGRSLEGVNVNPVQYWCLIPGSGRSLEGVNGNPVQYWCLENPHGQRSLVGYSPWGSKESDMTELLSMNTYIK